MLIVPARRLTSRWVGARHGFTTAELLIVLVLGVLILGIASRVGIRLERHLDAESKAFAAEEQLAAGAEILPIDLRGLSPTAGDIPPGGARDSSLEVRATIGSGVVCAAGSTAGPIQLAIHRGPSGRPGTLRAEAGDTVWLLVADDSTERWHASQVKSAKRGVGVCALAGNGTDKVLDVAHPLTLELGDATATPVGTIVRLTRRQRFSFYRAGDDRWYLGLRSWSNALSAFNGIQPVSGPYASPSSPYGVRFRYFDSTGAALPSASIATTTIARIEARLAVDRSFPGMPDVDSLIVAVALRNRDD